MARTIAAEKAGTSTLTRKFLVVIAATIGRLRRDRRDFPSRLR
jgi:hypothetical protein